MNRKEFFTTSVKGAVGCCALALFNGGAPAPAAEQTDADREKDFVKNWMEDLFDTMYAELDEKTRVQLMAGCGRGCVRRFQFKQEIARLRKGKCGTPHRGLQAELRGVARRQPGPHPLWRRQQAVLLPGSALSSGKTPRHPLRMHPRQSPDDLRDGSGAARSRDHRRIAAPRRSNLPLRGRHRLTDRFTLPRLRIPASRRTGRPYRSYRPKPGSNPGVFSHSRSPHGVATLPC